VLSLLPALALIAAAAVLTLPVALGPVRLNDSFWIDWVWLDQFAEVLRNGTLYPRWLPLSHGGLGAPDFYYYPPIAFYLGSAFVLAGLSTYGAIIATFFAGYVLAGGAMYWWLRGWARSPLVGAVVYLAAPYHTFNFAIRGAVAEFVATAVLPLVMLGIRQSFDGRRGAFALTAISYAALIASHLPLALLASLFVIGPYALFLATQRPGVLSVAAALALGVALAAIYLAPALMLGAFRDTANLWAQPLLQPANWTFWYSAPHDAAAYRAILVIVATIVLPLAGLAIRNRSGWAMAGIATALIAAGTTPFLWSLPLLRSVQFPFRLLPVSEFLLATAVAMASWKRISSAVPLLPLFAISGFIVAATPRGPAVTLAELQSLHPDVPENLPPGERPYSWPSRWALEVAAAHRSAQSQNGLTTLPLFYFPAWQVICDGRAVETLPAPNTQLLSYRGRDCSPRLGLTMPERVGAATSLLALLVLLAGGAIGAIRQLRQARAGPKGTRQKAAP
jgi:hypothetical protein